jgi:hypothetical protein
MAVVELFLLKAHALSIKLRAPCARNHSCTCGSVQMRAVSPLRRCHAKARFRRALSELYVPHTTCNSESAARPDSPIRRHTGRPFREWSSFWRHEHESVALNQHRAYFAFPSPKSILCIIEAMHRTGLDGTSHPSFALGSKSRNLHRDPLLHPHSI